MYAELRELREGQQVLLREVTLQQQLEAQYSQRAALQAGFSSFWNPHAARWRLENYGAWDDASDDAYIRVHTADAMWHHEADDASIGKRAHALTLLLLWPQLQGLNIYVLSPSGTGAGGSKKGVGGADR